MFPARAGMNRNQRHRRTRFPNVPRTRGDEPSFDIEILDLDGMFPARAGMNRSGRA